MNIDKALELTGISYILYMNGDKEYIRQNQPCYGELRKYERTHKGECTQPLNPKPGDLRDPFPEGTPTSLIIPFPDMNKSIESTAFLRAIFSTDSPWVSGFREVEFIDVSGQVAGVILKDLRIDTTVLVNLLKTVQKMRHKTHEFTELCTAGATNNEALAITMLNGMSYNFGVTETDSYAGPRIFSARRFFEQRPNDLTGGYLCDRVDYNRTDMANPFRGIEADGGFNWRLKAIGAGLPVYRGASVLKADRMVEVAKQVFTEAIKAEKAPEEVRFIWTTTSGRTNGKVELAA